MEKPKHFLIIPFAICALLAGSCSSTSEYSEEFNKLKEEIRTIEDDNKDLANNIKKLTDEKNDGIESQNESQNEKEKVQSDYDALFGETIRSLTRDSEALDSEIQSSEKTINDAQKQIDNLNKLEKEAEDYLEKLRDGDFW